MAKQPFENVVQYLFQITARAEFKTLTDQELLKRYVEHRDELAFAELVRRYKAMVWYVCWRVLRNQHDVEDAFQATIMTLVRRAKTIVSRETIEGWMHRTAFTVASNAKVARVRRREREERSATMRKENYRSHESPWELSEVLDRELTRIPEKYRSPLLLCYLDGLTWNEAARRLGISIDSLEWRLEQGRKQLKQRLSEYGMEWSPTMLVPGIKPGVHAPEIPQGLVEKTLDMVRVMTLSSGPLETAGISAQVATLVRGALGGWTLKVKICFGVLLMTLMGVGAGIARRPGFFWELLRSEQPKEIKPDPVFKKIDEPQANKIPPHTDRYGDPLPPGALHRLGTVRFRHVFGEAGSKVVAFTPDGKCLLTSGKFPRLWDMSTGKLLRQFGGPFEKNRSFGNTALSPDGKLVAARLTLAMDPLHCNIYIWETITGGLIRQLKIKNGDISGLGCVFSPDSKMLAAWSSDGRNQTLNLWDIANGHCRWEHKSKKARNPPDQNLLVAFSPNGKIVADGGISGIRLLDARTGQFLQTLGHPWPVSHVSFSSDARTLVVGYSRGGEGNHHSIYLWDIATGEKQWYLDKKGANYSYYAPTSDGKLMAVGNENNGISLREITTGKELHCLQTAFVGWPGWPWNATVTFSPDGKILAAIIDSVIRFWDVATGKILAHQPFQGHEATVDSIAFTPDGKSLISGGDNQAINVWDAHTSQQQATLRQESSLRPLPGFDIFMSSVAAISPDGKMIAGRCFDITPGLDPNDWVAFCNQFRAAICVWDTATRREVRKLEWRLGRHRLRRVVFSPDGKLLAACVITNRGPKNTILLWEVATGRKLDLPIEGTDPVFFPDGTLLMTRNHGELLLWEVASGKKVSSITVVAGKVAREAQLIISPDWRMLAINSLNSDNIVTLCSLYSNQDTKIRLGSLQTIDNPSQASIRSLAFSADGKMLAVGRSDQTVYVWDTVTRKERSHFTGHKGAISSLSFSPDGRRLASGSEDTTSLVWDITGGLLDNRGQLRLVQLSEQELNLLWIDLSSTVAAQANRALWTLAAAPEQTVLYFQKHLAPIPIKQTSTQKISRLIARLDDEKFPIRQNAMVELAKLGEIAEPSLHQALDKRPPSLELRRRLEHLLAAVESQRKEPAGDFVRVLRAIEILEQIGTREARQLLETLAQGAPGARQTWEARAALCRLQKRAKRR